MSGAIFGKTSSADKQKTIVETVVSSGRARQVQHAFICTEHRSTSTFRDLRINACAAPFSFGMMMAVVVEVAAASAGRQKGPCYYEAAGSPGDYPRLRFAQWQCQCPRAILLKSKTTHRLVARRVRGCHIPGAVGAATNAGTLHGNELSS
jgi:hypothetical protein